jgi:microcystin-dependent protein
MDSLKFSDNTIQTTALNEAYVTSLIQNALNNMVLRIPAGTIHAYVGDVAPTGYYLCDGGLRTISGHPDLWNAIGHKYSNGLTIFPDNFYLPDFRGAFLKGRGLSPMWVHTTSINIGARQNGSVGHHSHRYTDRGVTSRNVFTTTGSPQSVLQASSDQFFTDGKSYHSTTQAESDAENRPNGVGVNYIIKF